VRNIFLFIRRFSNFLFFLVLQIVSLYFLFTYNRFHQAAFNSVAGEVTGKISAQQTNISDYFRLKKVNESLNQENARLRSLLRENYQGPDSSRQVIVDSIRIDSLLSIKRFDYLPAKVVGNFVSMQNNYLMIHRGSNQGVQKDWGVIGPDGIVGRVVDVSANHATVMSVLNRNFKVNCQLKTSGNNGSAYWDGANPSYIYLKDIPKSDSVKRGDTVLTSQLSDIYPPGIMVGTIAEIVTNNASSFYTLKLKTATNFYNVQHVIVIHDMQKEERLQLEQAIKKQ
jgi:rod shape-determining protein MreC